VSREDLGLAPGEPNPAQPVDETGSHGWQSVPLLWLHDTLLGVRITRPGGGRIVVAPDDGGLPFVAGHTSTPKGLVWVMWEPRAGRLEVELPANVTAEVVWPAARAGGGIVALAAPRDPRPADEGESPPRRFEVDGPGRYVFGVR
jgi:hypothetical protein